MACFLAELFAVMLHRRSLQGHTPTVEGIQILKTATGMGSLMW
jgi:hypothetical protein